MSLKSILTKLFGCNVHPAHQPYTPTPPTSQSNTTASQNQIPVNPTGSNGAYTEMQANIQSIAGTDIKLGTDNDCHRGFKWLCSGSNQEPPTLLNPSI